MSRSAKPWDILNPKIEKVTSEVQKTRYSICEKCPRFFSMTNQCLECGCFMNIKTHLSNATCPLNNW
jgi:hypothetical protein